MIILILIGIVFANNWFSNLTDQYQSFRDSLESTMIMLPYQLMDNILGLNIETNEKLKKQVIQENNLHFIDNNNQYKRRILQNDTSNDNTSNNTNNGTTINEYDRQGPLFYPDCGFGQIILINVTKYYCYRTLVSYQQYYDIITSDPEQCVIRYRFAYGCHCPPDFYYQKCAYWNEIVCDLDQTLETCDSKDTFYYNNKFEGDPPCTWVAPDNQINASTKAICYNKNQATLNVTVWSPHENFTVVWSNYTKGIHGLQPYFYEYDVYEPSNLFIYWEFATLPENVEKLKYFYNPKQLYLKTNILKSSLEFYIRPYVNLINYEYLNKSKIIEQNMSLDIPQLMGSSYFVVTFIPGQGKSFYGRYYAEIYLNIEIYSKQIETSQQQSNDWNYTYTNTNQTNNTKFIFTASNSPKLLVYEDIEYIEPLKQDFFNRNKIISIMILIVVILLLGTYILYNYRRRIVEMNDVRINPNIQEQSN